MDSDLDPHFQLKGSYSMLKILDLTNSEGDTFTVENIEGNSLFVRFSKLHILILQKTNFNKPLHIQHFTTEGVIQPR